ncbi:hypothetical protein [Photobacterium toruni]|uniref:Uncharacterized protein n=1 Tax=Photobacterium toruni TaxID=1935446 RepID=A0A1T4UWG1_9GAMM|nr:hypothetical protein [Photobacterium toruni]SKA57017.1 hypothetical protein CZ814_03817 [Photobacterium toruni]
MSFGRAKPVTINSQVLSKVNDKVEDYLVEYEDIVLLCKFLSKLDSLLYKTYKEISVMWLGREIILTGLCGAIGNYRNKNKLSSSQVFEYVYEIISKSSTSLNINEFDNARKNLLLSKVNIGQVTKKAVYSGFNDLFFNKTN